MLKRKPKIEKLMERGIVAKEATEGAAIIASRLSHGKYRKLVETMKLKDWGTIFDYINICDKEELIERYSTLIT